MSGIGIVVAELRRGESRLADELVAVSERHRDEAEVHFVARDLAQWSREHARLLATHKSGLANRARETAEDLLRAARETATSTLTPRAVAPLILLRDLRGIYLAASGNSLGWEMLAQVAQSTSNSELLDLASSCHPQTLRQIRWANTMIKTLSPQVLSSV